MRIIGFIPARGFRVAEKWTIRKIYGWARRPYGETAVFAKLMTLP